MATVSTRAIPALDGFPAGTLTFLRELGAQNDKGWFDAHRAEYERDYLAPALAFIDAMREPFQMPARVDPDHPRGELLRHDALHAMVEEPVPRSISSRAFIDHRVEPYRSLTPMRAWVAELGGSDRGVR